MQYFRCVRTGVPLDPLIAELQANEAAWLVDTSRQDRLPEQHYTQTITLRGVTRQPGQRGQRIWDIQASVETRLAVNFPLAMQFMNQTATDVGGWLSRAMIVRLEPDRQVFPHIDVGAYYAIRDRYHLVLISPDGSVLYSGNESVRMQPGELWWFDNKQQHEAQNPSGSTWRVHYVFDVLPYGVIPPR